METPEDVSFELRLFLLRTLYLLGSIFDYLLIPGNVVIATAIIQEGATFETDLLMAVISGASGYCK